MCNRDTGNGRGGKEKRVSSIFLWDQRKYTAGEVAEKKPEAKGLLLLLKGRNKSARVCTGVRVIGGDDSKKRTYEHAHRAGKYVVFDYWTISRTRSDYSVSTAFFLCYFPRQLNFPIFLVWFSFLFLCFFSYCLLPVLHCSCMCSLLLLRSPFLNDCCLLFNAFDIYFISVLKSLTSLYLVFSYINGYNQR